MKALGWAISSSKWKSVSFSPQGNWEGSIPSFRSFEHQVGVASGEASLHACVSGLVAVLPDERLALSPETLIFAATPAANYQLWICSVAFTGRTDAEAETPVLWPPDAKS